MKAIPDTEFGEGSEKGSEKSSEKILQLISENRYISAQELSEVLGIGSRAVEKQMANLKDKGLLKRIGPDKGGYWEVYLENRELNS